MRPIKPHALLAVLLVASSLTLTLEARSPRRNRNRAKARSSDPPTETEENGVCELEVTCPGRRGSPVSYPIKGPARRLARESKGKQGRELADGDAAQADDTGR
ncbi:hypothetical protein ElyMa_000952400 [Elysia marginata]|uniref:Secreted protein n=1 Tax=Elysia marginata TaxID=1093978 RepID=A0AAV4HC06_9GAST|nr:hypothetical protein ElyMa_000952400 [Elysia marginata]